MKAPSPVFNLYQVGPSVSYSLDLFGRTRRRIEQGFQFVAVASDVAMLLAKAQAELAAADPAVVTATDAAASRRADRTGIRQLEHFPPTRTPVRRGKCDQI